MILILYISFQVPVEEDTEAVIVETGSNSSMYINHLIDFSGEGPFYYKLWCIYSI